MTSHETLKAWAKVGIAEQAEAWQQAGVTEPKAAKALHEAGLKPADLGLPPPEKMLAHARSTPCTPSRSGSASSGASSTTRAAPCARSSTISCSTPGAARLLHGDDAEAEAGDAEDEDDEDDAGEDDEDDAGEDDDETDEEAEAEDNQAQDQAQEASAT
ncbi:hypothetical protein [Nannocystis pusilla]|uniref:hypothetical protein n=1 Tax=Nannocystis pusilla TaxID=889268 RepID=UPI003B7618C2